MGVRTWRERMLAGEPFEMPDWDFIGAVGKARDLSNEFNRLPASDPERRLDMLRQLFGAFGEGSWIEPVLTIDLGFNTTVGKDVFINANCTLLDTYPISIGNGVQIGPGTMLLAVGHPVRLAERKRIDPATGEARGITTGAPIVIEDDVWLGGGVIVMPGITIGARSVIGAGSVVTRSMPADVVAAGNPCRVIRPIDN